MKFLTALICITAYMGFLGTKLSAEIETVIISIQEELKESNTTKPISWVVVPDGSGRSLLVLQGGQVLIVPADLKGIKDFLLFKIIF